MSDTTDENTQEPTGKDLRSQLEASLSEAKAAKAEADGLKRQLAFTGVKGLDLSNPAHKFFAEKYDGDVNAEAVTTAFSDLFGAQQQSQESMQQSPDTSAWARMDAASNGAQPGNVSDSEAARQKDLMDTPPGPEFEAKLKSYGYATDLFNN